MLIRGAKIFCGRSFIDADIQFDRTVTAVGSLSGPTDINAAGCYVIPGLVDIHTHGAVGGSFSDGDPAALAAAGNYYAAHGVTSFLATTLTRPEPDLIAAMHAVRAYRRQGGAKCVGVHLEGPFLSCNKRGAHNPDCLRAPDINLFDRLNAASGGRVRLITLACDTEGAPALIRHAAQVCTVSLGHTNADYDTALTAYAAGATHTTHLYNAMPPLLHRQPGVIGAALDSNASVELICDGLHIHPAVIRATYRMFGERLILVSDSISCAGMPDGDYQLSGQSITVTAGRALVSGTDTLAGSSISLLDAVRNAVHFGLPLEAAVYAASAAPARAAGLDAGILRIGGAADLVILDQQMNPLAVFIDGEEQ